MQVSVRIGLWLVVWATISFLVACTPVSDSYPSLVNKGPLALSTTNPFLGANLYLAGELERSRYLFNFFQNRGAPVAIEIIQPTMSPTRILLYYPQQREVYAADLFQDEKRREWIVRGPFEIDRLDYRTLARMETSMAGEPVFELHGKPYRFRFQRSSDSTPKTSPIIPEVAPTPVPTKTRKPLAKVIREPAKPVPTPEPALPTIDVFKPLSSDQQALLIARGFARRDTNGDILHNVTDGSQTLEQIVKWYTGSVAALDEVKKSSSLQSIEPGMALSVGTLVRIPLGLIKETKAMPAS